MITRSIYVYNLYINVMEYNNVVSIGMRCFTEIFLKSLNLKKFSMPFDGMYSNNIENIIHVLENGIDFAELIFSEDILEKSIVELNKNHGFRTLKKNDYDINNLVKSYHTAFLPHHNLKNKEDAQHFKRCFDRIMKIKEHQIPTLFCLFVYPKYGNEYMKDNNVSLKEAIKISDYIGNKFKGKLLVCIFDETKFNFSWKCVFEDEKLSYILINKSSHNFNDVESIMNEIMSYMGVDKSKLLSYDELNTLNHIH